MSAIVPKAVAFFGHTTSVVLNYTFSTAEKVGLIATHAFQMLANHPKETAICAGITLIGGTVYLAYKIVDQDLRRKMIWDYKFKAD